MNWTKLSVATTLAAAIIVSPTMAHVDDPVPTVDEVVGIMQQLTDPNIPAMNKGNIVTPGFSPEEAAKIDDHLHRMDAHGGELPLPFIVTDIQPAPNNFAGATIATGGPPMEPFWPIVLVNHGGTGCSLTTALWAR